MKNKHLEDTAWKCFVKALDDRDSLRMSQCAQEQEQAVLKGFIDGNPDLRKKLDSIERLLIYFKSSIERRKDRSMYEIGKLEGFVKCLQALQMENSLNELSMQEFEEAKEHLSLELRNSAKKAINFLYKSGCSPNELKCEVKLDEQEFNKLITVLRVYGILSVTISEEYYSLSETGNRIARQLKKQNEKVKRD